MLKNANILIIVLIKKSKPECSQSLEIIEMLSSEAVFLFSTVRSIM